MIADNPVPQVDPEALAAEVAAYLGQIPVGEGIGVKLNRLLLGFIQAEVLPQADRAAAHGLDPTPLFAVVIDILHLYADALERPEASGG